ncbi:methyltransferase domain-containing protein [Streptomyces sp. NPDC059740]|uniref:methyltransferase domain-containing protein n=1 Tax=Streptomyces sp. NPDC059740 TaxID=3346926 RepID=UPI003657CF02
MNDPTGPGWHAVEVASTRLEVRVDAAPPHGGRRLWPSVGEYPVYDEFLYYVMLQDEPRNTLFEQAITAHAQGRTVVELGTGPDLLWSTLAAKHGARRVLAVEALEHSAREAARRAAALGPHVSVVHGDATEVELPERGDMCVVELVGAIGGAEGIADAVADAWKRHLRPGAVVVPNRVRTRVAALGARRLLGGEPALHPDVVPYLGEVLRSVGSVFDLRMCLTGLTAADLMTTSDLLEDLDLAADRQHHARRLRLEVTRPGAIDSGVLWLELQCAADQEVLDSLETVTNWMPVLLPFHLSEPVPVTPGDVLHLDVTRRLFDGVHPEWSFTGSIEHADGSVTPVTAESPYADGPFRGSWLHRELLREAAPDTP